MSLFNGGLKNLLQDFHPIQNIANAVGSLLGSTSSAASGLIGGVAGAATGILNTPVVGAVASGLVSKYTGYDTSNTLQKLTSSSAGKSSVQGPKATGLNKFINIFKLVDGTPMIQGSDGTVYLNIATTDGKKDIDWMKAISFGVSILTLGIIVFKVGKSKRWWK